MSIDERGTYDLYDNPEYNSCMECKQQFEESKDGIYYKNIMCLKETGAACQKGPIRTAFEHMKPFVRNTLEDIQTHNNKSLCVLPKDHSGKCCSNYNKLFKHEALTKKLNYIDKTEGDNDYIYKNRNSRIFPIAIPDSFEKKIKDKNQKKKCAIPLKNSTSPFGKATALFDYAVCFSTIEGIEPYRDDDEYRKYKPKFDEHKQYLNTKYSEYGRSPFNDDGKLICPVTKEKINIDIIIKSDRTDAKNIQVGHIIPRSNHQFTIRGGNILPMTRDGNRIVGDYPFLEDIGQTTKWETELLKCVSTDAMERELAKRKRI